MTMATAKRILRRSLACVLLAGAAPLAAADDTDGTWAAAEMSPADLRAQVAADASSLVILDVRTPEEFAAGYIPGASNVDLNGPDFKGEVGKLPKDGEYAVYCRSGNRSATALAQMKELGFTNAYHLAGGIGAWQAAGGEIAVATP